MTSREVKCLICGEICSGRLIYHLKKVHLMTTKQYREIYPNAPVICQEEALAIKIRLTERNRSEKQRSIISERNHDPEFQKKCQEGFTEESRKAQSDNMRKVSKACWEDEEYRENHRKLARETQLRESQKPEVKKRKSEKFKELWQNPEYAEKAIKAPKSHPYGVQSEFISKKFKKTFYCRSQGERDFLYFCEENTEVVDVLSGTMLPILYTCEENSQHTYIPDFIVRTSDGSTYIIEIKYEDDPIESHKNKVNSAVDYCKQHCMTYCYINRFSGIKKVKENGFKSVAVLERI